MSTEINKTDNSSDNVTCLACKNSIIEHPSLKFVSFPTDTKLAQIWIENSGLNNVDLNSLHKYILCAEHFEDKYFENKDRSKFNKSIELVPTIFHPVFSNKNEALKGIRKKYSYKLCHFCSKLQPRHTFLPINNKFNKHYFYQKLIKLILEKTNDLPQDICSACSEEIRYCNKILMKFKGIESKLPKFNSNSITFNQDVTDAIENEQKKKKFHFQCTECLNIFNTQKDMQEHAKNLHPSSEVEIISKIIQINLTNNVVESNHTELQSTETASENHLNNEHLNLSKETQTQSKNVKNKPSKKVEYKFQCVVCLSVFNSKPEIFKHTKKAHRITTENRIISKIIKIQSEDKESYLIANNDNSIEKLDKETDYALQCTTCSELFDNLKSFMNHFLQNHSELDTSNIILKAVLRSSIMNQESVCLNDDLDENSFSVQYQCSICLNLFNSNDEVLNHKLLYHPTENINIDTSLVVQKRTEEEIIFNELNEPKYQCTVCFVILDSNDDMVNHVLSDHIHTPNQKYFASRIIYANNIENLKEYQNLLGEDNTIVEIELNSKDNKIQKEIICKRWKCCKCSLLFPTQQSLIQHSLEDHQVTSGVNKIFCKIVKFKKKIFVTHSSQLLSERYECLACCFLFSTKVQFVRHIRNCHPHLINNKIICRLLQWNLLDKHISCLHCNEQFYNKIKYHLHMKEHRSFTCYVCGQTFNNILIYKNHKQTHDVPAWIYNCVFCKEKFTNKNDIINHTKIHSASWKIHSCVECNEQFYSKQKLLAHENIHRIPEQVSCSKCNAKFTSAFDLRKHLQNHESGLCNICGKQFVTNQLSKHMEIHSEELRYKCKHCPKAFKTRHSLFCHKRRHEPNEKRYMCQICGNLFRYHGSLRVHLKIHANVRSYICEICNKGFVRSDYLRRHKKRHYTLPAFGEQRFKKIPTKQFRCGVCKETFLEKTLLSAHYKTHEDIYKCDQCEKAFKTAKNLKLHQFTHQNIYYSCDCGKKFRNLKSLEVHELKHIKDSFICPICKQTFIQRAEMIKHWRDHITSEYLVETNFSNEDKSSTNDGYVSDNNFS